jgi:hypothetical protein
MKKSIILILILLIVLTGCKKGGPNAGNVDTEIHKGTKGIDISFVNNAPPSQVYEGDSIDVSLQIKNLGAYPESESFIGKLELRGFDPASISGIWDGGNTIPTTLVGKNQYNPEGGFAIKTYTDRDGVHVPFDADYYDPIILAHYCYKYKTVADAMVCIDPDPYKIVGEQKVCSIHDVSLSGGQGAPIAVTKIEEEVGSDQIYFRIHISNVGGGSVMTPGSYNDCPFNLELRNLNKVIANVKLPYDASPSCTPKGTATDPIRLNNGQGFIFCKFDKPAEESAYTTSLNVELEYTYSNSISKQIKIVNIK